MNVSTHTWEDCPVEELFTLKPAGGGQADLEAMMKVQIDVPVDGKYEIAVTYRRGPDQGTFHVNQRQERSRCWQR